MSGVVSWKVWPVSNLAQQHATTSNNMQQGVQTDATCNIQQCWELLVNNVASVCTQPKVGQLPILERTMKQMDTNTRKLEKETREIRCWFGAFLTFLRGLFLKFLLFERVNCSVFLTLTLLKYLFSSVLVAPGYANLSNCKLTRTNSFEVRNFFGLICNCLNCNYHGDDHIFI